MPGGTAALGEVHSDLAEPGMLFLLLKLRVESIACLKEKIKLDKEGFLGELQARAAQYRLADLAGVTAPGEWLAAVHVRAPRHARVLAHLCSAAASRARPRSRWE